MINLGCVKVYPIGTYVQFINGTKENECNEKLPIGMILEINIKSNGVLYFTSWWDGVSRHTEWLDELEFIPVSSNVEKNRIGF